MKGEKAAVQAQEAGMSERSEATALDRLPTLAPVRTVARKLGVNERTLYHYARTGVVGSYRLEGLILLDVEEVAAWIQASYRPPKRR